MRIMGHHLRSDFEIARAFELEKKVNLKNKQGKGSRSHKPLFLISLLLHVVLILSTAFIQHEKPATHDGVVMITDYVAPDDYPLVRHEFKLNLQTVDFAAECNNVKFSDLAAGTSSFGKEFNASQLEESKSEDQPLAAAPVEGFEGADIPAMPYVRVSSRPAKLGYENRTKNGIRKSLEAHGGDDLTNKSVGKALTWLVSQQEVDGSWNISNRARTKSSDSMRFTASACALLAFLGAGHNEVQGDYKKEVRNTVRALNRMIQQHMLKSNSGQPRFGKNYGSALGLMALSETCIAGSSPLSRKNANAIAQMFLEDHSSSTRGAWGYGGAGEDLSVSGWVALSLKSAKAAELDCMMTPEAGTVLQNYKQWIDTLMTDPETGMAAYRPGRKPNMNMTWVGMSQKQILGAPHNDPFLMKANDNCLEKKWVYQAMSGDSIKDVYLVYYGTLVSFQQQGKLWKEWNSRMKPWIANLQRKNGEFAGSWDPSSDRLGKEGGRIMTTALMTLSLEVYYRYGLIN